MCVVHIFQVLYLRKFKKLVPLCLNGDLVFQHEDYTSDNVDKSPKLMYLDYKICSEMLKKQVFFHILHHIIGAPKYTKTWAFLFHQIS